MHTGGGWKGSPGTAWKSSHRTTGPSSKDGPTPATSTATCGDEEELPKNLLTKAIRCDDEQTLGVFTTTTAPACTTAQTPSTAIRPEGERPGAPLSKAHRTSAEVQCNKQTKPSAPAPACTTAQTQGTAIRPKGERPCAPPSEAHRTSPEMRCKRKQAELPAPDHACTIAHAPGTALHPEGKRPDAPLSTAAYEHAPRSAFSTEHPWEPTPGSMSGRSTEHPWELAPGSMSGLRTEHPWEPAPGSMSGQRTKHTWELTPCSLSGQRTEHTCELAPCSLSGHSSEHPWEPTPGSLPGQHNGYTSELAPCTEPWGHRWRSALETTRCRGAACIEFWPQQTTTVYPLPTLEPRDDPAPQGEPTVAAQAGLDLMTTTFPERGSQYLSAEPQKGFFWEKTFPPEEVDYEHVGLDTALTATATEPMIPVVNSLFLWASTGAPSAAPRTTPVPSIFVGTDVCIQGGVTAAAIEAELPAPLEAADPSPYPECPVTDGFPSPDAPSAAPCTTP
ncbi:hypothetical protein T484DRAFT_1860633, partial [Baffinella frigidus]